MSTGSAAIPLLKAAPEAGQLADRLSDGSWQGLELCLLPSDVRDDAAAERAARVVREHTDGLGLELIAEAPVSWPSGSFVRVDRLDDEARSGIARSARFAAAIGSPVLTIHLFAPVAPDRYRAGYVPAADAVERFLDCYARASLEHGVKPLIENVPPILRMRRGGVFLSPIGGHWRDLLAWRDRIPQLGFTLDISHAALFRSLAVGYPSLLDAGPAADLDLDRYVDELGPAAEVAHISDSHGLLGEGLPYGEGEIALDPVVRRLAHMVPFLVAEINEPDPGTSVHMKAAHRAIAGVAQTPDPRPDRSSAAVRREEFDWGAVLERRDPVPAVLELQDQIGERSVLITGGAGSLGRALARFLDVFRPRQVTLLDVHERALIADSRTRDPESRGRVDYALCDIRDGGRLRAEMQRARPDIVFHLAAYKHVHLAERFPEEFVDTNLHGTWNVLRAAEELGVETVVVASTDKAALAANFYARTKRLMEQLTAFAAQRDGAQRLAVRLVNVLGSAGSASELFLEQARAGVPLTVTEPAMRRYWITMGHAVSLAAHGMLLAAEGKTLATPDDPAELSVGQLAERVWRRVRGSEKAQIEIVGIRHGETFAEVLTGPGETLADHPHQGIAVVAGEIPTAAAAWVTEHLGEAAIGPDARRVWLEAIKRSALPAPEQR